MADGRFVAYTRVSTARQGRSGLGLEAQRGAVAAYLNGGAWKLIGEYQEIESGRHDDRPELLKALAHCRSHGAALVVAKVDRLARSQSFLSKILDAGVDVRFCDLPQIEGPTGRFLLQSMMSVAELEAGMIKARTMAALAVAKANGKKLGGRRWQRVDKAAAAATVGALAVALAGSPANAAKAAASAAEARGAALAAGRAAPTVARIARTKNACTHARDVEEALRKADPDGASSLNKIAGRLNDDGVRTPSGKGLWTATAVARVRRRLGTRAPAELSL